MFDIGAIFSYLKRTFSRRDVFLILLLVVAYFVTRLVNLDKFPIFTDEGIYIRWAKVAWHDANWRFISLTDGRQPIQTWGTIPFLRFFPDNPLFAGRLFAVTTGFAALTGLFASTLYLFGKRAALWAGFFYIITPYFLFYDRMALVDSGVNASFIWILFLSIALALTRRLDMALIFGLVGGLALLTKSSAQLFLALSALAPLLFWEKSIKKFGKNAVNFWFLYIVGLVLAFVLYNIQRLSPFFNFINEKNKTFLLTFSEWKSAPFQIFFPNLKTIPYYVLSEASYILPLIGIMGFVLLFKKDRRLFIYLLMWFLGPFLAIAFLGRVIFPRYLIFFASLFVIATSYFLVIVKNRVVKLLAIIILIASCVYFDYTILFNQTKIPFPPTDRGQYIEGISAGTGIKEMLDFARNKSHEKPVILLAEGNFGVVGDMLDAPLTPSDKITIRGYWPLEKEHLIKNQKELKDYNVYIVFSHRTEFPGDWPMKLVKKYDKPGGKSAFYLYELTK